MFFRGFNFINTRDLKYLKQIQLFDYILNKQQAHLSAFHL